MWLAEVDLKSWWKWLRTLAALLMPSVSCALVRTGLQWRLSLAVWSGKHGAFLRLECGASGNAAAQAGSSRRKRRKAATSHSTHA